MAACVDLTIVDDDKQAVGPLCIMMKDPPTGMDVSTVCCAISQVASRLAMLYSIFVKDGVIKGAVIDHTNIDIMLGPTRPGKGYMVPADTGVCMLRRDADKMFTHVPFKMPPTAELPPLPPGVTMKPEGAVGTTLMKALQVMPGIVTAWLTLTLIYPGTVFEVQFDQAGASARVVVLYTKSGEWIREVTAPEKLVVFSVPRGDPDSMFVKLVGDNNDFAMTKMDGGIVAMATSIAATDRGGIALVDAEGNYVSLHEVDTVSARLKNPDAVKLLKQFNGINAE
jgi:hypothetical protein